MFSYIFPTLFFALISTGVFIFTIIFTNPNDNEGKIILINLVYFFVSGFLSLALFLTLVLYWLSNLVGSEERLTSVEALHKPKIKFRKSLRHAFLFSTAVTGIGLLNSLGFANPLNIILLITATILIEVYFFSH